jgi:uncharacterized membrane protein YfcA
LIEISAILFLATFIRSAFGFGEALVAVPLLALLMPVEQAAPVAVLVSITVAAIVVAQDWRHVHFRSAARLFLPTVVGTPLGLLMLMVVPGDVVKVILAAVIIAFSSYCLIGQSRIVLSDDRFAWIFGFFAGILGGAYGMNGPPLVIYGAFRRWSPQHFRATLQGYFLPASMIVMGGYALTGFWTKAVTHDYLRALPAVFAAVVLGRAVNQRLSGDSFLRYVHIGLIATAVMLLVQSSG